MADERIHGHELLSDAALKELLCCNALALLVVDLLDKILLLLHRTKFFNVNSIQDRARSLDRSHDRFDLPLEHTDATDEGSTASFIACDVRGDLGERVQAFWNCTAQDLSDALLDLPVHRVLDRRVPVQDSDRTFERRCTAFYSRCATFERRCTAIEERVSGRAVENLGVDFGVECFVASNACGFLGFEVAFESGVRGLVVGDDLGDVGLTSRCFGRDRVLERVDSGTASSGLASDLGIDERLANDVVSRARVSSDLRELQELQHVRAVELEHFFSDARGVLYAECFVVREKDLRSVDRLSGSAADKFLLDCHGSKFSFEV